MSTDEFFDGLKTDWQGTNVQLGDVEAHVAEGERKLRHQKHVRLGSLLFYAVAMVVFFYLGHMMENLLFRLGGVAFLVGLIFTGSELLFLRRVTGADFVADSRTVVERAERQAQTAVMLTQGALGTAVLMSVCAIIAAGLGITGRAEMLPSMVLAVVWAFVGAVQFLKQRRSSTEAEAELKQFQSLRAELESEA